MILGLVATWIGLYKLWRVMEIVFVNPFFLFSDTVVVVCIYIMKTTFDLKT